MHMQFSMISWNVNFLWILRFEGFVTVITLMVRRKMRTFNMVHQCRPVWVHLATKRTRIYAFPRGITFFTWRWQRCDPWRKFYYFTKFSFITNIIINNVHVYKELYNISCDLSARYTLFIPMKLWNMNIKIIFCIKYLVNGKKWKIWAFLGKKLEGLVRGIWNLARRNFRSCFEKS